MDPHRPDYAQPANPSQSLLTPKFALLLTATAAFGLSFSAYFLLPKFLALQLHADAATIGSISALSLLASVFFMPIIGVQVDRRGRKVFACLGGLIFAAACAGFLWVDSVGPLLWSLRIAQGLAFTLFYVSLSTLATYISPAERLGQAIGLFGAVMISTNAIGPALAEWGADRYGWTAVFLATLGSAALSSLLTLCIPDHTTPPVREHATSMLQVVTRPGLRRVLLVAVMVGWTFGALFTFYQPWALTFGAQHVSGYLVGFAMCAMLVRIGLGSLADRLGRLRVARAALVLYIVAPVSLIWLEFLGLFVTGGLLGLAHGIFFPALNAVAVDHTQDSERGKAMAAYHGAFNIGFAAGSVLLGYLATVTGYPTIFWIAALFCCGAFALLARVPGTATGA